MPTTTVNTRDPYGELLEAVGVPEYRYDQRRGRRSAKWTESQRRVRRAQAAILSGDRTDQLELLPDDRPPLVFASRLSDRQVGFVRPT